MRKLVGISLLLALTTSVVTAQNKVLDGVYIKENTPTRRVIPYTHVREADVMWTKRVWRELDMREKLNHPLYYPVTPIAGRKSLFDVIKTGITEGTITAYGNAALDDEFTVELTKAEAEATLGEWVNIFREDADGNLIPDSAYENIGSSDIKRFWLKEDWFFDRERSIMDVRIIGIAPLREKVDDDGITVRGYSPLFWVYFPEARYVFANYDIFNASNEAENRTYEDLFWKRKFSSYIRKEGNVYDRYLADYKQGIDVLLESEEIKNKLFIFEHDLWEF